MGRVYKNGQRVRIIAKYGGNPVGEIVKYVRSLDTYNIKGDDGYNYNCVDAEEMEILEEASADNESKAVVEKTKKASNVSDIHKTPKHINVEADSEILQLKSLSNINQKITLSPSQVQNLVVEISELEKEIKRLKNGMKKIKMSVDFYSSEDTEE